MKVLPGGWLLLAVAACSGPQPPSPTVIELSVTAVSGLNPAPPDGRPSPVVVQVYELVRSDGFLGADFYQLSGDAAVLGKDLVNQEQFTMMPGTSRSMVRTLDPQTRFIGLTTAYRTIDQADWRAVTPVPPNRTTPVRVRLDPLAVSLVPVGGNS